VILKSASDAAASGVGKARLSGAGMTQKKPPKADSVGAACRKKSPAVFLTEATPPYLSERDRDLLRFAANTIGDADCSALFRRLLRDADRP